MLIHLALVGVLTAAAASEALPEGWKLEELAAPLTSRGAKPPEVRLLAWVVEEDQRPLYLERALVWARSGDGYLLASLYRHPRERGTWALSRVFDAPQEPIHSFDHPPTAEEALAFLGASWWSQQPHSGFKVLRSGVREATWTQTFGAPARPERWPKASR